MKKIFTTLFLLSATLASFAAPDTTKVLFIGNSFTAVQNVPGLVKGFADMAGLPFKFAMHAPGGITVGDISQGTDAHAFNPVVFDLIRSDDWDYVVLQDNQGRFIEANGVFPPPAASRVLYGHLKITDSMRYYHGCAHMIFFAGWAFKDGYPGISPDAEGLIKNIYFNYGILNTSAKEIIAPIGPAWLRGMKQVPATDLWSPDLAHQSLAGAYLTAAVIFSTIYRTNTEQIAFNSSLDTATARKYRRIAYQTVKDSITSTNLLAFTPKLTRTATSVTATPGFKKYEWLKNGAALSSGTANTITIANNSDCYQVIATNDDGCRQPSELICAIGTTGGGIGGGGGTNVNALQNSADKISIYPNPATDMITVTAGLDGTLKHCIITDITGHTVYTGDFSGNSIEITTGNLQAGIYFCTIAKGNIVSHMKFAKN